MAEQGLLSKEIDVSTHIHTHTTFVHTHQAHLKRKEEKTRESQQPITRGVWNRNRAQLEEA